MHIRYLFTIPAFLFVTVFAFSQEWDKEKLLQAWDNSLLYTQEVAALMPDSLYDFKPTEEQMTFQTQLLHMAGNITWISKRYFGADTIDLQEDMLDTITPATARKLVEEAYQNARSAFESLDSAQWSEIHDFFAGPMNGQQLVHLLFDHQTHHRGQLIVYLRLKGIDPPRYRGW